MLDKYAVKGGVLGHHAAVVIAADKHFALDAPPAPSAPRAIVRVIVPRSAPATQFDVSTAAYILATPARQRVGLSESNDATPD